MVVGTAVCLTLSRDTGTRCEREVRTIKEEGEEGETEEEEGDVKKRGRRERKRKDKKRGG